MAIRERAPAGERCHAGYATLLYELAGLHYDEGYFDDAERHADVAIGCLERTLGPDHVIAVDSTAIRVLIWTGQGRYAAAEDLARRSLTRRSALHEEDSPAVDNAQHQLARVLYERGKLDEAMRYETAALARRELAYGHVHASVAESLQGVGDLHLARLDARAAETAYRDALALWRQTLGEDHPNVADCMRRLSEALVAQGQAAAARPIAEDALALQRQRLRPGHPAIASTLAVLGTIAQAGSPAAAERMLREALMIRRAALPPEHAATARAESSLGECLALQHRTAEALPLLGHAAEVLRAQLGEDHPATRLAWQRRQAAAPAPPR
jgi:tetratricopeptide (TPR) repeat protein